MQIKKLFLPIALLSLSLTSVLGLGRSVKAEENIPDEYQLIKRVVNKLAKSNDLGKRPIFFTITSGYATEWAAEELNLCKEDDCNCDDPDMQYSQGANYNGNTYGTNASGFLAQPSPRTFLLTFKTAL